MKHIFLILTYFLIGPIFLKGQSNFHDFQIKPESHNFKELEVWRYNLRSDEDTTIVPSNLCYELEDSVLYLTEKYNDKQLPVYRAGFIGYHCLYAVEKIRYDQLNRIIKKTVYRKDSAISKQHEYTYNDNEKNCMITYIEGKDRASQILQYNKQNFLTESITKENGETWRSFQLVKYDTLLQTLVWVITFEDETNYRIENQNEHGDILKSITLDSDSSFSYGDYYTHNDQNLLIERKWMVSKASQKNVRERTLYRYSQDGIHMVTEMHGDGDLKDIIYKKWN